MSATLLTQTDSAISQQLTQALERVQTRFLEELKSELECVNNLTAHIEQYRGKMLRPTLVILSALASQPERKTIEDEHIVLSTVVEMVHMATLVHDDILDEAKMRRRGSTINSLFGNEAAVMLGDYLISHSYHLCSSLNKPHINKQIALATNQVCEGELLQLSNRNNRFLDEKTYFDIIQRKTASLCGICCKLSADIDGADTNRVLALHEFGEKLGMAFQIIDDLLDLTGDQQTVGKTLGIDLEKGKMTLPIIRYLELTDKSNQEQMRKLLEGQSNPKISDQQRTEDLTSIREFLEKSDSVEYSRGYAKQLIGEAKTALQQNLEQSPAQELLLNMADAVLAREY